jgi:hypothetical protein
LEFPWSERSFSSDEECNCGLYPMNKDPKRSETSADIFVFGSDLAGRHSGDEALTALRNYGATYGRAVGLQGRSYAIPVRDEQGKLLPIPVISRYVQAFIKFAATHRDVKFHVTRVGCGREAYRDEQVAPLFTQAPQNCELPRGWQRYLKR